MSGTHTTQLKDVKVLIVDDALDNRIVISRFLERAGATVTQAESGQEAIAKAMSTPFDLLLMDIQMPYLDGFETTKLLRAMGFSKPILALTAHAMKEDRARALEAGCNDHITKPVSPVNLVDTIRRFSHDRCL